jgi:hypothetical protein
MVMTDPDRALLSYVTVSAGPWQSWTGWLAYLPWPPQVTAAAAVTTRTAHACGDHVVQMDTWRAGPPLRVERGQLIAALFVVAITNAGRPELTEVSPGVDKLGWRIVEWRSSSTADLVEVTVDVRDETLAGVHREMVSLASDEGEIVTIPAIGPRPR